MTYGEIFVHPSAWLITFFFTAILTPGKNIDRTKAVLIGFITYLLLSSSSFPLLSLLYSLIPYSLFVLPLLQPSHPLLSLPSLPPSFPFSSTPLLKFS